MSVKHIAFLALTMTRGGAERVIANLCNDYLVKHYKVSIITCMNKPLGYSLDSRIEYTCIEKTSDIHYSNIMQKFVKRRALLKRELERIHPDVLLCFLPEPNFLALSLKKHFRFPMIISVRNDPNREYKNLVYQAIMRYLYPKADGYVFQTHQAKDYFSFAKKIANKAKIIPNPLGNEFLEVEQISEKDRKKVIANVGKLSGQKNQKVLIDAFARIEKAFPDYILNIYGEGKLRQELQSQIEVLGMSQKVFLKGNVPNVSKEIQDASLFVLSSDYEGMPNALMEALALGIPCVSTDCPCGGPEFLMKNKENGVLVPVGDVERLAEAMSELLQDREKAGGYGIEAMKIAELLHPDVIHKQWEDYIKEIML